MTLLLFSGELVDERAGLVRKEVLTSAKLTLPVLKIEGVLSPVFARAVIGTKIALSWGEGSPKLGE
jgi:hypothetical protein